jgi:GAF domain-containing protein
MRITHVSDPSDADEARLAVLRDTGLLTEVETEPFDRITNLARRLLSVDSAMVSLVDRERQVFAGHAGPPGKLAQERETDLTHSFCKYAVASGERFIVEDAREDPLVRESPAIEDHNVVAYAGEPLRVFDGTVLGTLCVVDSMPRRWSREELEILQELTALAVTEIEYRLRLHDMAAVETLAERLSEPLTRLGDAVRTVTNLAKDGGGPRLPRVADHARSRLATVEALADDLQMATGQHRRRRRPEPAQVDLVDRLARAAAFAGDAARVGDLIVETPDQPVSVCWPPAQLDRGLAVVLMSALHHLGEDRRVAIRLTLANDEAHVHVTSPGHAMPVADLMRLAGGFHSSAASGETMDVSARDGVTRVRSGVVWATTGAAGTEVEIVLPLVPTERLGAAREQTKRGRHAGPRIDSDTTRA